MEQPFSEEEEMCVLFFFNSWLYPSPLFVLLLLFTNADTDQTFLIFY